MIWYLLTSIICFYCKVHCNFVFLKIRYKLRFNDYYCQQRTLIYGSAVNTFAGWHLAKIQVLTTLIDTIQQCAWHKKILQVKSDHFFHASVLLQPWPEALYIQVVRPYVLNCVFPILLIAISQEGLEGISFDAHVHFDIKDELVRFKWPKVRGHFLCLKSRIITITF